MSSPAGQMGEKTPTDSATALIAKPGPLETKEEATVVPATTTTTTTTTGPTTAPTSPVETLTRRLSGKAVSKPEVSKEAAAGTSTTREKPIRTQPAQSASQPIPRTQSNSTSTPASRQSQNPASKKKKKRKGFAGILAALGCLSTNDVDDDVRPARASGAGPTHTTTPATKQTTTQTETANPATKPADPSPEVERTQQLTGGTGTTSGTLVEGTETGPTGTHVVPAAAAGAALGTAAGAAAALVPKEPAIPPVEEVRVRPRPRFLLLTTTDRWAHVWRRPATGIRIRIIVHPSPSHLLTTEL